MKTILGILLCFFTSLSCNNNENKTGKKQESISLIGTWQLISGTTIEKGKSTKVDYTKDQKAIKMFNATHFSFFIHDLKKGKVKSSNFVAGAGTYTLLGNKYTELLEYCNYRDWEQTRVEFSITFLHDTLTIHGLEKIDSLGVNQTIIEKYTRLK